MPANSAKPIPFNAEALNAMSSALGALAMCLARQLTEAQRQGLRTDLSRIAGIAEKEGDTTLQALLTDLHRAV